MQLQLLRFFLFTYGGLWLLSLIALGRQLVSEHLSTKSRFRTLRGSIEGWLLFVAALVLAVRYLSGLAGTRDFPGIGTGWLLGYAGCCGAYLVAKTVRTFRGRS